MNEEYPVISFKLSTNWTTISLEDLLAQEGAKLMKAWDACGEERRKTTKLEPIQEELRKPKSKQGI